MASYLLKRIHEPSCQQKLILLLTIVCSYTRKIAIPNPNPSPCGKVRCKICKFVKTGSIFESRVEKKSFHINHSFDCDSSGVVYLITRKRCVKQHVRSTITEFRKRFNNHKSSMNRYGKGQGYLWRTFICTFFFEEGRLGL